MTKQYKPPSAEAPQALNQLSSVSSPYSRQAMLTKIYNLTQLASVNKMSVSRYDSLYCSSDIDSITCSCDYTNQCTFTQSQCHEKIMQFKEYIANT